MLTHTLVMWLDTAGRNSIFISCFLLCLAASSTGYGSLWSLSAQAEQVKRLMRDLSCDGSLRSPRTFSECACVTGHAHRHRFYLRRRPLIGSFETAPPPHLYQLNKWAVSLSVSPAYFQAIHRKKKTMDHQALRANESALKWEHFALSCYWWLITCVEVGEVCFCHDSEKQETLSGQFVSISRLFF